MRKYHFTQKWQLRKLLLFNFIICIRIFTLSEGVCAQAIIGNSFILPAGDGQLKVEVCSKNIFRIRFSSENYFPQTLLERYKILKNDWSVTKFTANSINGKQIISTSAYTLTIAQKDASIEVRSTNGKTVINKIDFANAGQPIAQLLKSSLDQYFDNIKSGGGIIGDSNYTGQKKLKDSLLQNNQASVIDISIDSDERFYGGGAASRKNIQHRGEALRIWATYQHSDAVAPFLLSSKGWGIFNNTTSLNYFDVGRYNSDKLMLYNTDGNIDFFLMLGNSMDSIINEYTTITGKPYLMPKWAYGLAFGGNTMENQIDILNDAIRFRDEKIPCDIQWIEVQWMSKNYDYSTSKNWDFDKFPGESFWEENKLKKYKNPLLFPYKLEKLGFKLALWLCIDHDLSTFEEDLIAKAEDRPTSGVENWFEHLMKFVDQGVDGFKLDPGRTLDEHPDRKYFNGFSDKEMHNLNQVLLPKQMCQTFRNHTGLRSFHHYCGGYAGTQHWGASTSGDNGGGRNALYDQLNLGLSGFVNTSADVMEVFDGNNLGAMHLGFFLPWVQVNSWAWLHHPWFLPPTEKDAFRFYAQLRNSLNPYIYSAAIYGSLTGKPILRAMAMEFPNDRNVDNTVYQFMFGENMLVGVFNDSVYLPTGNWLNYWTNELTPGGKIVNANVPDNRGGALFIKPGAIIPFQKTMQYIGEFSTDTLILKIYPDNKSEFTMYEDDGITFNYEKGEVATTKFTCLKNLNNVEFSINPTIGNYNSMKMARVYNLQILQSNNPNKVKVNNRVIKNWEYSNNRILNITINQENITTKMLVNVIY